jgi:hypothetical protein
MENPRIPIYPHRYGYGNDLGMGPGMDAGLPVGYGFR